ncbi:MAG: 50S ribosomal protein L15 [Patescibacteria group bacterium]|jgi:large subunit ribosomal protein L15
MIQLQSVSTKSRKRVGRGLSAGQGKTAGRGTKGQKSRAGHNIPNRYEGGQSPLSLRLPKLPGFKSFRPKAAIISLDQISGAFKDGETVSKASLVEKGLISPREIVKILNNGELTVKVILGSDVKVSKSIADKFDRVPAKEEVEAKTSTSKPKILKAKKAE